MVEVCEAESDQSECEQGYVEEIEEAYSPIYGFFEMPGIKDKAGAERNEASKAKQGSG